MARHQAGQHVQPVQEYDHAPQDAIGGVAMSAWLKAAGCGLMGAALILGTATSRALAEDDEPTFDQKIMQTLGLRGGADIDYRERSPLVIPPKIDLPPPQA